MKKNMMLVAVCLAVMFGAIAVLQLSTNDADERMLNDIETATAEAMDKAEALDATPQIETPDVKAVEPQAAMPLQSSLTNDGALVIGDVNAPITIIEYSSLSCGHCAAFHRDTLPLLKKDYVDDGTLKIVFQDFPLNQQAMDGSKLLRCVDVNDRYDFMNLLFEQQGQWAYGDANYQNKLKQYAALLGMSTDKADACMADKAVENLIITNLQSASKTHKINSTPTFVMEPNGEVLTGARPYGDFAKAIEGMLKEKN